MASSLARGFYWVEVRQSGFSLGPTIGLHYGLSHWCIEGWDGYFEANLTVLSGLLRLKDAPPIEEHAGQVTQHEEPGTDPGSTDD